MSDQIPAALTPEEWAEWTSTHGVEGRLSYVSDRDDVIIIDGDYDAKERHGIAALCLHGQPFGFTPQMVAAIEYNALGTGRKDLLPVRADGAIDHAATLTLCAAAAARIAALLPPPSPTIPSPP